MLQTFYLLVIAHFIADFVLQGSLAVKKRGFNKYMLAHGAIMALAFFLPLINYPSGKVVLGTFILFAGHMLIDAVRYEANRIFKVVPGTYAFAVSLGIDQILHISVLYLLFNYLIIH
jgi:hypothetical protein